VQTEFNSLSSIAQKFVIPGVNPCYVVTRSQVVHEGASDHRLVHVELLLGWRLRRRLDAALLVGFNPLVEKPEESLRESITSQLVAEGVLHCPAPVESISFIDLLCNMACDRPLVGECPTAYV